MLTVANTGYFLNYSKLYLLAGLHVSLYSGVYSSCIAFTKSIGTNTKQLLGYTGILVGVGEVTGLHYIINVIRCCGVQIIFVIEESGEGGGLM